MADGNGRASRSSPKRNAVRKYFFLEGRLYKVLSITRAQDIVIVWDFKETKRKAFVWTDVKRRRKRAFTMQETGQLLGRNRVTIQRDILAGRIKAPQQANQPGSRRTGRYYFSDEDILAYHDYMQTIVPGTGLGKLHKNMISKTELRALMNSDVVTYVKNSEGEFIPIWKEIDW